MKLRQPPLRLTIIFIAACALLAGAAATFGSNSAAAADNQAAVVRPALTITTAQPQTTGVPLRVAANGSLAAWQEAIVGAESAGLRLVEVLVNVGDVVKKGQPLARFATETLDADVAQARAALVEAEASAADARGNADRARTLQNTGALSTQQINQFATGAATAEARVAAAKATLRAQQLRLGYARVVAPDNGVISARSATVGSVLGSGGELFRLIRGGRLEWRAEVIAGELGRIRPGTAVLVTAPSGAQLKGTVRTVAPTVDAATRNALVYVDVPAHPDAKAGMFARGEFDLGQSQALTVPAQALVARDGFSYVFAVVPAEAKESKDKDGKPVTARPATGTRVVQRKVDVGRRIGDRVEILRGVDAATTVAVRGAGFLNEGDLVRVANDAPPTAAAAAPATAATTAAAAEPKLPAAPANAAQPATK